MIGGGGGGGHLPHSLETLIISPIVEWLLGKIYRCGFFLDPFRMFINAKEADSWIPSLVV